MSRFENIQPAFENNNNVIVLTSSDLYSPYVGILLQSMIGNSSVTNNYDVFVFETDISAQNKTVLKTMVEDLSNFSLRFIDISEEIDGKEFTVVNVNHSKYNFYRLLMLDVLVNFRKAIYLDTDLVLNEDIANLYNTDVEDFYVAAVKDIRISYRYNMPRRWEKDYCDNVLKLKVPYEYFSSGVMVMNLDLLRADFTSDQLIDTSMSKAWKTVEQDVLNMLFQGRVRFLGFKWNCTIETPKKEEHLAPEEMYADYISARENPSIVHYVGNSLPWKKPGVDMYHHFWKYARKSPFYEVLLHRMIQEAITSRVAEIETAAGAEPVGTAVPISEPAQSDIKKKIKSKIKRAISNNR